MRQRQIGQHAVLGTDAEALLHRLGGPAYGIEIHGHALGHAGGTGGVDDGGQFLAVTHRVAGQRLGLGDDGLPGGIVVRRRQRIGNAVQALRDAGFHLRPFIELANEYRDRLAVLQDLTHRIGGERGIQRHADVAGHPDREIAHQPVRAILGQDRHPAARRIALCLQVGRHPAGLAHRLRPTVVAALPAAHGLGEIGLVGARALPVPQTLQRQILAGHGHAFLLELLQGPAWGNPAY